MNGRNSRVSGIAATMSRPKISGLRCVAIGRFSAVFSRFSAADSALAIPVSGDRDLSLGANSVLSIARTIGRPAAKRGQSPADWVTQ